MIKRASMPFGWLALKSDFFFYARDRRNDRTKDEGLIRGRKDVKEIELGIIHV
jgi:hypothetical protein